MSRPPIPPASNPNDTRRPSSQTGAPASPRPLRVALVCDWLTNVGGAERVLLSLSDLFPSAPIYTSQYNRKKIDWFLDRDVRVGWLQIFPSSLRRFLGPLRQSYFSHLNLSDYDLIISVTGAEAKSVKFDPQKSLHLCYCHVPTQYYWGMSDDYQKNPGFGLLNPLVRLALKFLLPPLKRKDYAAAQRPTNFITISSYAATEIKKSYGRDSKIIFPPVAVKQLIMTRPKPVEKPVENSNPTRPNRRHGFVTTSRQVSWKRLDLAIEACLNLNLPLTLVGSGPEHKRLKKLVKKSKNPKKRELITFASETDRAGLKRYLESAEGFIFPSLEPFGIAPVEALACGCPVIAYGRGGALDYVIDGENGVLFSKQSVSSLISALKRFKTLSFSEPKIRTSALPFDEKLFQSKIKGYVLDQIAEKQGRPRKKSPKTAVAHVSRPDTLLASLAVAQKSPTPSRKKPAPAKSAPASPQPSTSKPAPVKPPVPKPPMQKPAPVKPAQKPVLKQSSVKVNSPKQKVPPQTATKVKQGNKKTTQQSTKNVKQIQIIGKETPKPPKPQSKPQPAKKITIS